MILPENKHKYSLSFLSILDGVLGYDCLKFQKVWKKIGRLNFLPNIHILIHFHHKTRISRLNLSFVAGYILKVSHNNENIIFVEKSNVDIFGQRNKTEKTFSL